MNAKDKRTATENFRCWCFIVWGKKTENPKGGWQPLSPPPPTPARPRVNISWRQHPTKLRFHGPIPDISTILRDRRMPFAGHCWRAKQELARNLLLWSPKTPNYGKWRAGCPAITYIDQLCRDKGCLPNDLPALLQDRDGWRDRLAHECPS